MITQKTCIANGGLLKYTNGASYCRTRIVRLTEAHKSCVLLKHHNWCALLKHTNGWKLVVNIKARPFYSQAKPLIYMCNIYTNRPICKYMYLCTHCRSQRPHGLRRGSVTALLLGLWLRIPPGTGMSVSCECCVLSGRGLCDGLITRPEESYRVWCV
jgi:hypothetical protein